MRFLPFVCLLSVALLFGCGKTEVPVTPTSGIVKDADGEPMANIVVQFMPDVRKKNTGPTSQGVTGEDGRFTLHTIDGTNREGAALGSHRVILFDQDEQRPAQGEEVSGPISRVPGRMQTENGAMEVEVKAGEEVALDVPTQ